MSNMLQIRDKLTGNVIIERTVESCLTTLQKDAMSRDLVTEAGIAKQGPYSLEDVYVTETNGSVCINKWELDV